MNVWKVCKSEQGCRLNSYKLFLSLFAVALKPNSKKPQEGKQKIPHNLVS